MLKIVLSYSRVAIPLMLGICIGIALSFMILPLLEESACEMRIAEVARSNSDTDHIYKSKRATSNHPFLEGLDLDSFRSAEFEPKVITTEQSGAQTAQKPKRNRFIQSELNMMSPLFIAYLTSPAQFGHRAAALNKTLTTMSGNVDYKFFTNTKMSTDAVDLPIQTFNLLEPSKLPLITIKYLMNQLNFASRYKYYLILPDTSYARVDLIYERLLKLKSKLFLGFDDLGSKTSACDLSAGFLLSQEAVRMIGESIHSCDKFYTEHPDKHKALANCISLLTHHACTSVFSESERFVSHTAVSGQLSLTAEVRKSFLLTNIQLPADIYLLKRLFAKEELNGIIDNINDIRQQITGMFPPGTASDSDDPWDSVAHQPLRTLNRYDILRWTLMADNTTYLAYDYENGSPLKAATATLQADMVSSTMAYLNREQNRYDLIKVVHSYTKSDPTRGKDFLLTLKLRDHVSRAEVLKTFEMVKPRSGLHIMPVRYSSSTTHVHILVPFIGDHLEELSILVEFFHQEFGHNPLISLHIVFGSREVGPEVDIGKYEQLRHYVREIEDQRELENKVKVLPAPGGVVHTWGLVTEAIKSIPDNVIVLTSTLTTEFTSAFMSRVYINTIQGKQAFAPIAFWEYAPELIYDKPRPDHVEVSRNIGHFGEQWYDHLAFFSNDYKRGIAGRENGFAEPIDVLTSTIGIEILRAPDPELLVRNYSPSCSVKTLHDRPRCTMQFLDNIGSGPILARSLIKDGFINGGIKSDHLN